MHAFLCKVRIHNDMNADTDRIFCDSQILFSSSQSLKVWSKRGGCECHAISRITNKASQVCQIVSWTKIVVQNSVPNYMCSRVALNSMFIQRGEFVMTWMHISIGFCLRLLEPLQPLLGFQNFVEGCTSRMSQICEMVTKNVNSASCVFLCKVVFKSDTSKCH